MTGSHVEKLSGIPYYGGKSARSSRGVGTWIASLLPPPPVMAYIEPFAGMLGVLLQRPPARQELAADRNCDVINWWRVVRDEPRAFSHLVEYTPQSRAEYLAACRLLTTTPPPDVNAPPDVRRALAWTAVIIQGRMRSDGNIRPNNWSAAYNCQPSTVSRQQVAALAERVRQLRLEVADACDLLERAVADPDTVVYCDPPYRTSVTRHYQQEMVDWSRLTDVLRRQRGRVAISGFHDEWDHLGWRRHEHETFCSIGYTGDERGTRTEHVWTNYEPPRQDGQPPLIAT